VDVFIDNTSPQYVFKQKHLNLHQTRWLELLKDYDMSVIYHLDKVNVVADTLSKLSMNRVSHIEDDKKEIVCDLHMFVHLGVSLIDFKDGGVIVQNGSESSLVSGVKTKYDNDSTLVKLKKMVLDKAIDEFSKGGDGVLYYQGHLCVLNVDELR